MIVALGLLLAASTVAQAQTLDAGAHAPPLWPPGVDAGLPRPAHPSEADDDADGYGASARVERPAGPGEFERGGTGSKFNVPLEEVPATVSIVDKTTLGERGVVDLQQALGLMAGVMPTLQYGGFQHVRVRGFQAVTLFDGRRDPRALLAESAPQVGLYDVERIELLRGASSLLYGYGSVGGAINLVRKRPSRNVGHELELGLGLPDQRRAHIGSQGPIDSDLSYRVDLGHVTHENLRGLRLQRNQATAALRYTPSRKQTVAVRVAYARDHYNMDVGIPTVEDLRRPGTWRLPENARLDNRYGTDHDRMKYERIELSADYRYEFTTRTRIEARASVTRDFYDYLAAEMLTYAPPGTASNETLSPRVDREYLWFKRRWTPVFNQLELYSKQRTGPVEHELLAGYQLDMLDGVSDRGDVGDALGATPGSVDFAHPVDRAPRVTFVRNARDNYRHVVQALYAFDHMRIVDGLIVTGGARLDRLRSHTRRQFVDSASAGEIPDPETGRRRAPNERRDLTVTGQLGAVYTPWQPLIAYVHYGTAYMPMLVTPGAPKATDYRPEHSDQFEGGLRVRSALGRHAVSADIAGYLIRKRNLLVPRGVDDFEQVGKAGSRGMDLSVRYVAPSVLQLDVAYSLTDARYLRYASADPVSGEVASRTGNRVDFAPLHGGTVWLRLLASEHVGVGVGSRLMGEQYGDPENRLPMERYALLDASLWFGNRRATFTLSATNLLDERDYFSSAINAWAPNPQLTPGAGRELLGVLRVNL